MPAYSYDCSDNKKKLTELKAQKLASVCVWYKQEKWDKEATSGELWEILEEQVTWGGYGARPYQDTGSARSVAGRGWIEDYVEDLDTQDKGDVGRKDGQGGIRFWNGKIFKSKQHMQIPVYLGRHKSVMDV